MIRLIAALCKALLEQISENDIYQGAVDGYIHHTERCPRCGAKGKLSPYSGYFRWLVSFDDMGIAAELIWVNRYKCGSCGATHALLPDILTPRSVYSLKFKLLALIAYFERETTVADVCGTFGIAISTLYAWKALAASHKELMIGALKNRKARPLDFLRKLLGSGNLSDELHRFFRKYGFSFMQRRSESAARSRPP